MISVQAWPESSHQTDSVQSEHPEEIYYFPTLEQKR
jgi:hypothetical protein